MVVGEERFAGFSTAKRSLMRPSERENSSPRKRTEIRKVRKRHTHTHTHYSLVHEPKTVLGTARGAPRSCAQYSRVRTAIGGPVRVAIVVAKSTTIFAFDAFSFGDRNHRDGNGLITLGYINSDNKRRNKVNINRNIGLFRSYHRPRFRKRYNRTPCNRNDLRNTRWVDLVRKKRFFPLVYGAVVSRVTGRVKILIFERSPVYKSASRRGFRRLLSARVVQPFIPSTVFANSFWRGEFITIEKCFTRKTYIDDETYTRYINDSKRLLLFSYDFRVRTIFGANSFPKG